MSEDGSRLEKAALQEFLDAQRDALVEKVEGLSDDDARLSPTASSLSVLSILKHSAIWEKRWFQVIVAGRTFPDEGPELRSHDPDATFRLEDHETVASVVAEYRTQIVASNQILATIDLDTPCAWPELKDHDLRWVALHMVEETARHAGHADIIRETIDNQLTS